jgi:hypothetical protein
MNTDQVEIVLQYLKIETNYAVIVNGHYGVGKTHFYKNELVPKIREISLAKNDQRKYTPIHISLFGFKSLEEIQTAIFVELFPILKNKGLKLAAGIGKSIIRGIAQINQAGDIDKYIGDISQDADEWLKYDELVICFDDLDRKSDSLDLRDIFGFINSLVENQGAKILIIANEEQLLKDTNYSSNLREKVIGVSIQYKPDAKTVYNQIIKSRYSSGDKTFYEFLSNSSNEIVSIIETNQNNFRNLIFFLEHFKTIFYPVEILFQSDKDFAVQKNDKLKAILSFTLAISIEYKLGLLNSTNFEDVKTLNENFNINLFSSNLSQSEEETKEPSYIDTFKKKYFSIEKYFFFKAIFEYLTGTKAFSIEILKAEIDSYFIVKDGVISEQNKLLNDLGYLGCLNLTDKKYKEMTLKMLSFLDEGKYHLQQHGTIFHFATRFNNMLNFDLAKLKKRFKTGIKKGKANYAYSHNLDFYMSVSRDTEFRDDVIEIVKYCLEINESLRETNDESKLQKLFKLFETDFNSFIETVEQMDNEFRFSPFWLQFDMRKIVKRLNELGNEQIWTLGHYFTSRYRRNIYEKLFPEKDFLVELRGHIDRPTTKRKKKNLHNASLGYLSKCITECENNFP